MKTPFENAVKQSKSGLKNYCLTLFSGFLIDKEYPLRINLPRDLVFSLLGKYDKDAIENGIVDVTWYYDEVYREHPFSLFDEKARQKQLAEEYDLWRKTQKNKPGPVEENFSSFKEILHYAHSNQRAIVIGESHNHITPKAIILHNIDLLQKLNAVVFIESLRKELQEEMNKSVSRQKPTPLIEAYLSTVDETSSLYTQRNLMRICISAGIPLIACETGTCKPQSFEGFVQLSNRKQIASIKRMLQNYEHHKAIAYAREAFPERTLHIALVGDAHTPSYSMSSSINPEIEDYHPGIVEITDGIYVQAVDLKKKHEGEVLVSESEFIKELEIILGEKIPKKCQCYIHFKLFDNKKNLRVLQNIEVILKTEESKTGLNLEGKNIEPLINNLYTKYSNYIYPVPKRKITDDPIIGYLASYPSGFQISAANEQEIIDIEDPLKVNILENTVFPADEHLEDISFEFVLLASRFLDEMGFIAFFIPIIGQLYLGARIVNEFEPLTKGSYSFFSCSCSSKNIEEDVSLEWNFVTNSK